MVRILAFLLALLPTSALAQATFTTVISPTTLGTSPLAVTFGTSPFGVICVSGCAAGASPSSVIVTNQPTVTASLSGSPFVYQGTAAWQVNIIGGSTIPVSANGPLFVQQGTSPWAIAGGVNVNNTVTTSLSTSAPYVNINTIPTVTTSAVAGTIAVNVNNTPTVSLASSPFVQPGTSPWAVIQTSGFTNVTSPLAVIATSAFVSNIGPAITFADSLTTASGPTAVAAFPFLWNGTNWDRTVGTSKLGAYVNVTNNGSTFTVAPTTSPLAVTLPLSPITVGTLTSGAVTNVMTAGTSALAVTPIISPVAVVVTSAAVTNVMAAGTSPIAVGPVTDSNLGTGYVSNAVWKSASLSSSSTGNQVLMNAPTANKLYITGIQCARTDAGTTAIMLAFNATLGNGTSAYLVIPNSGGGGGNNQTYSPPLTVAATTSLQFTPTASVNTLFCNAQGYNAP